MIEAFGLVVGSNLTMSTNVKPLFDLQLLQKRRALHFHGLMIMMGSGEVPRPRNRVGACQAMLVCNDAGRRKP